MVINVYKLQRLTGNERTAGTVTQGKQALPPSSQELGIHAPLETDFLPPSSSSHWKQPLLARLQTC